MYSRPARSGSCLARAHACTQRARGAHGSRRGWRGPPVDFCVLCNSCWTLRPSLGPHEAFETHSRVGVSPLGTTLTWVFIIAWPAAIGPESHPGQGRAIRAVDLVLGPLRHVSMVVTHPLCLFGAGNGAGSSSSGTEPITSAGASLHTDWASSES